ncbi:MAG TPA: hypothetical protein VFZ36_08035 [Vicinamibacterales bacterium]
MRMRRVLLLLLFGALIGFGIFAVLAWRAVDVEQAGAPEALRRFTAVRTALGGRAPLLTLDDAGNVVRRAAPPAQQPPPLSRLAVLAYQANEQRLVSAEVPFWFFRMKGPPTQFLVRGTGLDLERLEITAADLAKHGPSVVIDHARPNGDRLLVWTE